MKELLTFQNLHTRARMLVIVVVVGCLIVTLVTVVLAFRYAHNFSNRLYVINRGQALEAFSTSVNDNRMAEAKFHVVRFHELFFSLSPDPKAIEDGFKKASFLGDESVKLTHDRLKENQFYQQLIQTNTVQKIEVVESAVDMRTYPYLAKLTFKLIQQRASVRTTRTMVSQSELYEVSRSENNPNGILMRNFRIVARGPVTEEKITIE